MKALATLEGKNIRLRPIEPGDLDRLEEIINEPSVYPWWGMETRARMEEDFINDPEEEVWVIEKDGRVEGLIDSYEEKDPDYRHAGMDISISTEIQGKGYGGEALRLVARYLFGKGHHRLIIDPAVANERAIKAYKKIGFKPVGIMRQYERNVGAEGWHDNLLMDLLVEEFVERD
jgi:aminoglycoside 6'-N-acetyltransferase